MNTRLEHVLFGAAVLGICCLPGRSRAQLIDRDAVVQSSGAVSSDPQVSNGVTTAVDRQSEASLGAASVTGHRMSRRIALRPAQRTSIESQISSPFRVSRSAQFGPKVVLTTPSASAASSSPDSMLVNLSGPLPSLPAYRSKPQATSRRRSIHEPTGGPSSAHRMTPSMTRNARPSVLREGNQLDTPPR